MGEANADIAQAWELTQLIVQAAEKSKAAFGATAGSLNIPIPLARAILTLDEPAPMSALADILACDRSYITTISDQLEHRGLISRVTGIDRRVKLLALTPKGRQLRNELSTRVAQESLVLRTLSENQREELARLLSSMLSSR